MVNNKKKNIKIIKKRLKIKIITTTILQFNMIYTYFNKITFIIYFFRAM